MAADTTPPVTPPGDDEPTLDVGQPQEGAPMRDRRQYAGEEIDLGPGTLVGSWFHKLEGDDMIWQGVVVAEPQAQVYLIDVDVLEPGAEGVQILVPFARLLEEEWRFYDTQDDAREAFMRWVSTKSREKMEVD
jgi:hypothetical protein